MRGDISERRHRSGAVTVRGDINEGAVEVRGVKVRGRYKCEAVK